MKFLLEGPVVLFWASCLKKFIFFHNFFFLKWHIGCRPGSELDPLSWIWCIQIYGKMFILILILNLDQLSFEKAQSGSVKKIKLDPTPFFQNAVLVLYEMWCSFSWSGGCYAACSGSDKLQYKQGNSKRSSLTLHGKDIRIIRNIFWHMQDIEFWQLRSI